MEPFQIELKKITETSAILGLEFVRPVEKLERVYISLGYVGIEKDWISKILVMSCLIT